MSEWSIGAAIEEYDRQAYAQRELEREERFIPEHLVSTGPAHPPNECGDPAGCPAHAEDWASYSSSWPHAWCEKCGTAVPVVDESEEQIGFEEQAREVIVTHLDCGHDRTRPNRRQRP
jgi:hypothetical protein